MDFFKRRLDVNLIEPGTAQSNQTHAVCIQMINHCLVCGVIYKNNHTVESVRQSDGIRIQFGLKKGHMQVILPLCGGKKRGFVIWLCVKHSNFYHFPFLTFFILLLPVYSVPCFALFYSRYKASAFRNACADSMESAGINREAPQTVHRTRIPSGVTSASMRLSSGSVSPFF